MELKEIAKESYYHEKNGMLLKGDCLDWMSKFPDKSVDIILFYDTINYKKGNIYE